MSIPKIQTLTSNTRIRKNPINRHTQSRDMAIPKIIDLHDIRISHSAQRGPQMRIQRHPGPLREIEDRVVCPPDINNHGSLLRQRPHALEHFLTGPVSEPPQLVFDEEKGIAGVGPAASNPPVVIEDIGEGCRCGYEVGGIATPTDDNGGAGVGLDERGDEHV